MEELQVHAKFHNTIYIHNNVYVGDNIMWKSPYIQPDWWNMLQIIVSLIGRCYGYE